MIDVLADEIAVGIFLCGGEEQPPGTATGIVNALAEHGSYYRKFRIRTFFLFFAVAPAIRHRQLHHQFAQIIRREELPILAPRDRPLEDVAENVRPRLFHHVHEPREKLGELINVALALLAGNVRLYHLQVFLFPRPAGQAADHCGEPVIEHAFAPAILGIPCECNDPVPEARDGEIVIYYGAWDLPTLRNSAAGKKCMWQTQNWYDPYGWKAEPSHYRLLLPVPSSNCKNWTEQADHLRSIDAAWRPVPVAVAATILVVHLAETGVDLLRNDFCRCAETLPSGNRAGLMASTGRVHVSAYRAHWDDDVHEKLFLGAARKA